MSQNAVPQTHKLGAEFEVFPTNVLGFKTGQGSKYAYFDNGKIQRYKTVEQEYREPSDIIVFIPDFAWFKANAPAEMRDHFKNEKDYDTNLTLLAQGRDISPKIVDGQGNVFTSTEDLKKSGSVYVAFISKKISGSKAVQFYLPVAKAPQVGFRTFDMRFDKDTVSRHLGNKVVDITHGSPLPAEQIMPWRQRDPNEIS